MWVDVHHLKFLDKKMHNVWMGNSYIDDLGLKINGCG
jgi:hypothetical protein